MTYFDIKLNGDQAFCVDPDKPYGYGVHYREQKKIESQFIRRVYAWGAAGHQEDAQLLIWAMKKKGWFDQDMFWRNGSWGQNVVDQSYVNYTGDWGWSKKGEDNFVKYFGSTLKAGGSSNVSYTYDPKWIVPTGVCNCLDVSKEDIEKNGSTVKNCKRKFSAEYDTSDCMRWEGKTRCAVTMKVTDPEGQEFDAVYNAASLNNKNVNACKKIGEARDNGRDAYAQYEMEFWNNGIPSQYSGQMSSQNDSDIRNIYKDIMNTPPSKSLSVYEALPTDYSGEAPQRIISESPSDLPTAGCSNILYLLKLQYGGNVPQDMLDLLQKATGVTLVINGDTVQCSSRAKECVSQKTTKKVIGYKKKGFNPKFGAIMQPIFGGEITVTTYADDIDCGKVCENEYTKFLSTYGGDCNLFKSKIGDPENAHCIDGVSVTCDTVGPNTCDGLLPSYSGPQSDAKFKEFVNRITDKDKAVHNSDGTISCNACQPETKPGGAICKDKSATYFELKDATDDNGEPKDYCYHAGTAYQIDGQAKVGSKADDLSNSYCDVYCWESVGVNMPGAPSTPTDPAHAGKWFYWGMGNEQNGYFSTIETKRICWTQPKYSAFDTDWSTNETNITNSYNSYKALDDFVNADGYNTEKCTLTASCEDLDNGDPGYDCCMLYKPGTTKESGNCATGYTASSCAGNGNFKTGYGGRAAKCNKCPSGYTASGTSCEKDGTKYTRTVGSISGETSCYDGGQSDPESLVDNIKKKDRDDALKTLEGYIKKRQTLKDTLEACQSTSKVNKNTMYKYTAVMEFVTTEKNSLKDNGVTNYKLDGRLQDAIVSTTAPTGLYRTYNCNGNSGGLDANYVNPCQAADVTSWNAEDYSNTDFKWTYEGKYNFFYNEEFLFYAIKENMEVVNNVNDEYKPADYIFNKHLYYKEGYGFPISFSQHVGRFEIGMKISGLGNDGHFDKILDQNNPKEAYGYDFKNGEFCEYYVDNPNYCEECCEPPCDDGGDPNGLDIIYRVIEMGSGNNKKIFPGIEGKGRTIGSNWSEFIANDNEKYTNITSMGKIYDTTPMYTITLTPSTIGKIRSSNKSLREAGKDPYTSYRDKDNNVKITCDDKEDDSKTCVSSYITELILNGTITGTYAIQKEDLRLVKLADYKNCWKNGRLTC